MNISIDSNCSDYRIYVETRILHNPFFSRSNIFLKNNITPGGGVVGVYKIRVLVRVLVI